MIDKAQKDRQKKVLDKNDEVIQIDKDLLKEIKASAYISSRVMIYCCIRVKKKGNISPQEVS